MTHPINLLFIFTTLLLSCDNMEKMEMIIPDEFMIDKTNKSNNYILSLPKMTAQDVLIHAGQQTYTFLSDNETQYRIDFTHDVLLSESWDEYYDPDFTPSTLEEKRIEENYTKDSCIVIDQIEFGNITLKAFPKTNSIFTDQELKEIKKTIGQYHIQKYKPSQNLIPVLNESQRFDTLIKNVRLAGFHKANDKHIINMYFDTIEEDSILSFLYSELDYFHSIGQNGDVINVFKNTQSPKLKNQILERQYLYLNSSRNDESEGFGNGYFKHKFRCIYINE